MSSQEDLKAYTTGESDRKPITDQRYKSVSQTGFEKGDTSNSRNQYSNGNVQTSITASDMSQSTIPSSSYAAQRQPIDDAVTSAFRKTESSVSPELIHLITQNVLQQLQVHQTPSAPPVQPPQPSLRTDQTESFPSFQSSPTIDRATVYTPPSPNRPGEDSSDAESRFTMPHHPDLGVNSHGYKTSRHGNHSPLSRTSNEDAILSDSDTNALKQPNMRRSSADSEATVLEKHWGKLFDERGQGTQRLTQFLKGIANYLIEEVEPRHSLVITPDKMQRFYEVTSLEEHQEIYPWKFIFDDKTSSISRLLRDPGVQVEHHLVQTTPDARPDIPGLTPNGFAAWLMLLIQAHPDHEHERLSKILRLIAINHPDERKQRFPAALPRRLLPTSDDNSIVSRLSELMVTHCKVRIEGRHNSTATTLGSSIEPPQSPRKTDGPPAPTVEDVPDEGDFTQYQTRSPQRTSPRSQNDNQASDVPKAASVTSIEDDGDDTPTPQARPIERERKPYFAQPGGGKSYDVTSGDEREAKEADYEQNDLRRTKSVSASQRPGPPPPISVHQRGQAQLPNDMAELTHVRSAAESGESSPFRSRRYSTTPSQPHPFRRTRSNSTNVNESGKRYHPNQRSPSITKNGFDLQNPRATAAEVSYGGASYSTSASSSYPPPPPNNYQQPPNDRYVYSSRQQTYDPRMDSRYTGSQRERSRGRDVDAVPRASRSRHRSNAGAEGRAYHDESHRAPQQGYQNAPSQDASGAYQFPPSAYRDGKER